MNIFSTYVDFCKTYFLIAGVYCIHNTITDRRYIGESENVASRIHYHFLFLKHKNHRNKQLQIDYNTHGESSFEISLLCEVDEWTERVSKEQEITVDLISQGKSLYSSFLNNVNPAKKYKTDINAEEIKDLREKGLTWPQIKKELNLKYNLNYSHGWYQGKYKSLTKTGLAPTCRTVKHNLKIASQP